MACLEARIRKTEQGVKASDHSVAELLWQSSSFGLIILAW